MENEKESKSKSTDWRIDVIPFVGRARRFAYLWFLRFKWAALQVPILPIHHSGTDYTNSRSDYRDSSTDYTISASD